MLGKLIGKLRGAGRYKARTFWDTHKYVRTLPGGMPVFRKIWIDRSRYMPHQGARECERRMG